MKIQKIGIAGAGLMGTSMAQIFAKYGYDVVIYDAFPAALDKGRALAQTNQQAAVEAGEITPTQAQAVLDGLCFTNDLSDLTDRDIIIECIIEKLDVKQEFWSKLSPLMPDDVVLTTNTSGLSIHAIAQSVVNPSRFLGMHWFNPAHLVPLVEIICTEDTAPEAAQAVNELARAVGKKTTLCRKDVPGFIANRLQYALLREAMWLVENGVADVEDVDACMKYGLGFRYAAYGPFEVADFGGLDTFHHIMEYLNRELCTADTVQSPIDEHYRKGEYGVKTGKGFYDYTDRDPIAERDRKYMAIYNALYR